MDVYDPGAIDERYPQEPAYKAKNTWIMRIQQAHIRVFGDVPTLDEWVQPHYVSGKGSWKASLNRGLNRTLGERWDDYLNKHTVAGEPLRCIGGAPIMPTFLKQKQYQKRWVRGFNDLVHMWTNGHNLRSITGRLRGEHASTRICDTCSHYWQRPVADDQTHLFTECMVHEEEREQLLDALEEVETGFRAWYDRLDEPAEKLKALMVDAPEGMIMGVQQTEEKRLQATTAVCEYLEKTLSAHDAAKAWRKYLQS